MTLKPEMLESIKELQRKHFEQDQKEIFGDFPSVDEKVGSLKSVGGTSPISTNDNESCGGRGDQNTSVTIEELPDPVVPCDADAVDSSMRGTDFSRGSGLEKTDAAKLDQVNDGKSVPTISGNNLDRLEASEGGALWDIFRRKDVPKLQEYLKKHFREFRHIHCCPLPLVIWPVNVAVSSSVIYDTRFWRNLVVLPFIYFGSSKITMSTDFTWLIVAILHGDSRESDMISYVPCNGIMLSGRISE